MTREESLRMGTLVHHTIASQLQWDLNISNPLNNGDMISYYDRRENPQGGAERSGAEWSGAEIVKNLEQSPRLFVCSTTHAGYLLSNDHVIPSRV